MTPAPHVSVIIPCRNEAKYIGACLDSLLANDYPKERLEILEGLRDGSYPALVANQVLDEGVDVPEVKIAVVIGGTASTRQAKQRLGRILRRAAYSTGIAFTASFSARLSCVVESWARRTASRPIGYFYFFASGTSGVKTFRKYPSALQPPA